MRSSVWTVYKRFFDVPEAHIMYSSFLISNKFCNGGGGIGPSRAITFLYAPAPLPPPPTLWALKSPSWAHKTTYAPMIYTQPCACFG